MRSVLAVSFVAAATWFAPTSTETAAANGDTRTLHLRHLHTGETIDATFRVDGAYDPVVLAKLNWFLRDWRNDDPIAMDPRLFDAVWEVYRAAGATEPVAVVSAYRSPRTNAMLRARSAESGVAEHSQHMLGKAMDTTMPGMSMERVREVAMRLQYGGVGYYQSSNFVHLDVGNVRSWPRMTRETLSRVFPDGKTVHIPTDGRPMARYAEAKAEIAARYGAPAPSAIAPTGGGIGAVLTTLFGRGERPGQAAGDVPSYPSAGTVALAYAPTLGAATAIPSKGPPSPSPRPRPDADVAAPVAAAAIRAFPTLRAGKRVPAPPVGEAVAGTYQGVRSGAQTAPPSPVTVASRVDERVSVPRVVADRADAVTATPSPASAYADAVEADPGTAMAVDDGRVFAVLPHARVLGLRAAMRATGRVDR